MLNSATAISPSVRPRGRTAPPKVEQTLHVTPMVRWPRPAEVPELCEGGGVFRKVMHNCQPTGEGISGAAFYQRWLLVITPAEVKPLGMTGNYLALVAGDGVPADAVFRV